MLEVTGAICRKSPAATNGIPPKGSSFCMILQQTLWTHSIALTFAAGSSSQMIIVAFHTRSA